MNLTLFAIEENFHVMWEGGSSTYSYFENLENALKAFATRKEELHKEVIQHDQSIRLSIYPMTLKDCGKETLKIKEFSEWADKDRETVQVTVYFETQNLLDSFGDLR